MPAVVPRYDGAVAELPVYPPPGPAMPARLASADGLAGAPVAAVSEDDLKGLLFQNARLGGEQLGNDHRLPPLQPARPTIVNTTNAHRAGETRMA